MLSEFELSPGLEVSSSQGHGQLLPDDGFVTSGCFPESLPLLGWLPDELPPPP